MTKTKRKNGTIVVRNNTNGSKRQGNGLHFPGIAQNVAVSVQTPFNGSAKPATIASGLDATAPTHVPLPRAVGPYTVIRSTQIVNTVKHMNLFGPITTQATEGREWTNYCSFHDVVSGNPISSANNTKTEVFSTLDSATFGKTRMTPAAFSVQLMNPEALQTTTGVVYAARCMNQLALGGDSRTWDELANQLVTYQQPRLMAAAKLAMNGVKIDALPLDMNAISEFTPASYFSASVGATWGAGLRFDGFSPIFVYNPNAISLQYLITCEWRVRFDPENPAYAASRQYTASTPSYWERVLTFGAEMGSGVIDLAGPAIRQAAQRALETRLRGRGALALEL